MVLVGMGCVKRSPVSSRLVLVGVEEALEGLVLGGVVGG
ncbi:hypothetical protein EV648_115211, partial [Kribbella sp. VKM Ac-2568]